MASLGERGPSRRERLNKQSGEQTNSLLANAFFQVHVGVTGMSTESLAVLRGMEQAGYITPGVESGGVERKAERVSIPTEKEETAKVDDIAVTPQPEPEPTEVPDSSKPEEVKPREWEDRAVKIAKEEFLSSDSDTVWSVADGLRDNSDTTKPVSVTQQTDSEPTNVPESAKTEESKPKTWDERSVEIAKEFFPDADKESIELISQDIKEKSNELASMPEGEYKRYREDNEAWGNPVYDDYLRSERLQYVEAEKETVREELSKPAPEPDTKDDLFGPPRELTKEEKVWDKKLDYLANKKILSESKPEDFLRYSKNPEELQNKKSAIKAHFDTAAKSPDGFAASWLSEKELSDVQRLHEKFGPGNQADDKQDNPPPPKQQLSEKQEKIREARLNLHNKFMEQRQNQAAQMAAQWNPDMGAGWGDAFSGQVDPGQAFPEAVMKFAKESTNGHEATASTISELSLRVRMATQQIWEASR